MEEKRFELKMYFFVPYNISPIQQAIQAGHAALEYARKYGHTDLFGDFIDNWKTWIVLNGGTTNNKRIEGVPVGTLSQIADQLFFSGISHSKFFEPDLNDALTAVCFIADERVFNKEDYPDFVEYLNQKTNPLDDPMTWIKLKSTDIAVLKLQFGNYTYYNDWLELIGGKENEFLRELLKDKELA